MNSPTHRQWLILTAMAILAGAALGWSLRQIRAEREAQEQPLPVQTPAVQLRPLRVWPAPADREITETEAGISFTL